jgi:hypothetical protein
MLSTVMKDKEKIEDTIAELDRYKREALESTWKKVDGCVSPHSYGSWSQLRRSQRFWGHLR